jgi:hypothetical protein
MGVPVTTKPIPFRSRAKRYSLKKARATRARRRELLAIAQAGRSLVSMPAPALEWLFWDVRDWVKALPRDHANVAIATELETRIDSEYARRDRHNTTSFASAELAEMLDRRLIPFPSRARDDDSNPS